MRAAYNALSPPRRKLNRTSVLSSPAPSSFGVSGRDEIGAIWGSAVPQISHSVSVELFRKVHAGHAISFVGGVEGEGDRCTGGGAEAARGGVATVEGALGRGTPQSAHLAPVGLAPGGLRKSHTSHCQLASVSWPSATAGASGVK